MHILVSVGIFGLLVVICAGVLVPRLWDAFPPEPPPASGRFGTDWRDATDARVRALVDAVFTAHGASRPTT